MFVFQAVMNPNRTYMLDDIKQYTKGGGVLIKWSSGVFHDSVVEYRLIKQFREAHFIIHEGNNEKIVRKVTELNMTFPVVIVHYIVSLLTLMVVMSVLVCQLTLNFYFIIMAFSSSAHIRNACTSHRL